MLFLFAYCCLVFLLEAVSSVNRLQLFKFLTMFCVSWLALLIHSKKVWDSNSGPEKQANFCLVIGKIPFCKALYNSILKMPIKTKLSSFLLLSRSHLGLMQPMSAFTVMT